MMPLNPFLTSIAAPAAVKTVQAVVHVAHEAGQSFLKALTQFGERTAEAAPATENSTDSLQGQLTSFTAKFRDWLKQQGVAGPYEMQFHLANNGDPIANVVGRDSEKIIDLVYSNQDCLDQLTSLTQLAQTEQEQPATALGSGGAWQGSNPVKLAIASDGAYILQGATSVY